MKKSRYTRPLIAIIVLVGAYHVVLFSLRPKLPPVAKTEVVWGDMSTQQPQHLQNPLLEASFCTGGAEATTDGNTVITTGNDEATKHRIRFEYRPVAHDVLNAGDTVQVSMANGSSITLDGKSYQLKQLMFQKPKTGAAAGQMAFYLVHRASDGKVAVVTVPLQLGKAGNPVIETLWRYLPQQPGEHNSLDDIHLDINSLLPHDRSYYRYSDGNGACGKQVLWLGLQSPVTITAAQLTKLEKTLGKKTDTAL